MPSMVLALFASHAGETNALRLGFVAEVERSVHVRNEETLHLRSTA
jgi:hypothetical protein